jgi:hypothetical protein
MSLSFPGLISAVPLHAVDYSRSANQKAREAARKWRADYPGVAPKDALGKVAVLDYEVNWFSDGGISSNLPVHFFDAPLPTRPTFAVDLAPFPPDHPKSTSEAENSYLPAVNQGGVNRRWSRWGTSGLGSVGAFAHSIVDTARSWVDQAQLAMPGYRDRIVTIYHDHSEGGMNLTMDKDVVDHLADRGVAGATKLVDSFVHGDGWDNHRWIRFRTATAGLDGWLAGFDHGYTFATSDGTPYSLLAGPGAKAPLPSYKVEGDQRLTINLRTGALLTLAANWQTKPSGAFTTGSPTPRPVLRLVPGQILAEALDPAAASLKAPDPLQPGADTSTLDVPAD